MDRMGSFKDTSMPEQDAYCCSTFLSVSGRDASLISNALAFLKRTHLLT